MHATLARSYSVFARPHLAFPRARTGRPPRPRRTEATFLQLVCTALSLGRELERAPVGRQGALARRWAQQVGLIA